MNPLQNEQPTAIEVITNHPFEFAIVVVLAIAFGVFIYRSLG